VVHSSNCSRIRNNVNQSQRAATQRRAWTTRRRSVYVSGTFLLRDSQAHTHYIPFSPPRSTKSPVKRPELAQGAFGRAPAKWDLHASSRNWHEAQSKRSSENDQRRKFRERVRQQNWAISECPAVSGKQVSCARSPPPIENLLYIVQFTPPSSWGVEKKRSERDMRREPEERNLREAFHAWILPP
jgi:hypothetical protein